MWSQKTAVLVAVLAALAREDAVLASADLQPVPNATGDAAAATVLC
jgi:hypothetical protein